MGLVLDMPFEDYLAVDALSASGMRELSRSAWHFKHRVQIVPTPAMLNGTLTHCAQLEPDAMGARYVVVPEDAPKRPSKTQWAAKKPSPESVAAMAWWKDFSDRAAARRIVDAEAYAITQQQLEAIKAEPELSELFSSGYGEVSVFWVDKATGVYCKARPDWMHYTGARSVKVIDLKAVADDTPAGFSRSVTRLGYHRAQVHYRRGVESLGLKVDDFVFAAVSSTPPVLAVPYRLLDEAVLQGEEECDELLELYARCVANNNWPAYTPDERLVGLQGWAKRSQEIEVGYA
jgi:exodeoxyribonuclease VIII